MRIGEYKQIDSEIITKTIHHPAEIDDQGNEIAAWNETVSVEKPIMGMVYRDATDEEIAEMNQIPDDPIQYEQRVEQLIRERYTVSDELAILRQRDTKPEEFAAYNQFCEQCKAIAKGE